MSQKNHDTCHMHDKSRGMIKETSRDKFLDEKKEMEHELSHNKETVTKLLNEHYTYKTTSRTRGQYVVKFQHPESHKMERLNFNFEPNLKTLENMWQTKDQ